MKVNMPIALRKKRYHHDLSSTHITTLDVGDLRPTYVAPLLAGEKISLQYSQLTRLSSLQVPTFGNFSIRSAAYFVPYTTIWRRYEEWRKTGNDQSMSSDKSMPLVMMYNLFEPLGITTTISDYRPLLSVTGSNSFIEWESDMTYQNDDVTSWYNNNYANFSSDFVCASYSDVSESSVYFGNLTLKGRHYVNILESLGYNIPRILGGPFYNVGDTGNSYFNNKFSSLWLYSLDATALLSFYRVLYDYVFPSRYVNDLAVGGLFGDTSSIDWTALRELIFTAYDADWWTSLFVTPNTANGSVGSNGIVNNGSVLSPAESGSLAFGQTVNANIIDKTSGSATLSNYALRWLQSASDYVLRNNIGGTRFHEWMRSHFGFVTKMQDKDRSIFVKSFTDYVDISSVVSSTTTDYAQLGDQGGRGVSSGRNSLKFEAQEDGMFLVLTQLVPAVGYVHGLAPWTRYCNNSLDLFTPEFSDVGYEGIPSAELFSRCGVRLFDGSVPTPAQYTPRIATEPFGFAPRYSDRHKRGVDMLTGDFVFNSRNVDLGAYHTFRDVQASKSKLNDLDFLQVGKDYNRIFSDVPSQIDGGSLYDKFFSVFHFKVDKTSQIPSMSDSLPFFDEKASESVEYMGGN